MSHVLTLNAGSSSLKFGLYALEDQPKSLATGQVDRIGGAAALRLEDAGGAPVETPAIPAEAGRDHAAALATALEALAARVPGADIRAVGHRVVHGGPEFRAPVPLDGETIARLEALIPLAPLHQPHNLAGVRAAMAAFPRAIQVACFDTAFHRGHPFVNDVFGLPRRFYDQGVRRYGFHGLSYDYVAGELARREPRLHAGRVIVAHLGNGASMCGMVEGRSVGSSMGFSALDGLPMGTRSGQLDPGVLLYLMDQQGMSAGEITDLLYRQSGLLGLSGISHDMRTLEASEAPEAQQAIDYFVFRIRRELGGLTAALRGLDALVFCGGIGENSRRIRAEVCAGMAWFGIALDPERNAQNGPVISAEGSRVTVMVIPTDEEIVLARGAARFVAP